MSTIDHNENGSFVRAAWNATAEPQTETVYAMRAEFTDMEPEYWNAQPGPFTDERLRRSRESAQDSARRKGLRLLSFQEVKRTVTITATDWEVTE